MKTGGVKYKRGRSEVGWSWAGWSLVDGAAYRIACIARSVVGEEGVGGVVLGKKRGKRMKKGEPVFACARACVYAFMFVHVRARVRASVWC